MGGGSLVFEALESLYGPASSTLAFGSSSLNISTPQQKKSADRFLSKWQNTLEAWTGSIELIGTEQLPAAYRLFGAQTLRKKLMMDSSTQLDANQLQALRDVLARTPAGLSATRPFWIQIALCISRLSLVIKVNFLFYFLIAFISFNCFF